MRKSTLFGAIVFSLVLLLTGCGNGAGEDPDEIADLEIVDFEYVEDADHARIVRGVLVNQGDSDISGAQVKVALFDEDNRLTGTAYIEVRDIKAGESKNFRKVLDRDEEFAGARVESVLVL